MCRKLVLSVIIVLLPGLVSIAFAQEYYWWTGLGDGEDWYDGDNWDQLSVPGASDYAVLVSPPEQGPVITTNVTVSLIYGPRYYQYGNQSMDIEGGNLTVDYWYWSWTDNGTGTINISGSPNITIGGDWYACDDEGTAILNIDGSPDIDVYGWLIGSGSANTYFEMNMSGGSVFCYDFQIGDDGGGELNISGGTIDVADDMRLGGWQGSADITVNMTGGSITVADMLAVPPATDILPGIVTINLDGGTIGCGRLYHAEEPYDMNITEGTFIIAGDVRDDIYADIGAGYITAYDGDGTVNVELADGDTVVTASPPDPNCASRPNPPNGERVFGTQAALSWSPGINAIKHDVYLGTDFDDVNVAADPNVLPGRGRWDSNSYDVCDLELDKTYCWRVDEVNGMNIWKGRVWRFRVTDAYINSLGMVFYRIQPGTFTMGEGDVYRIQDEGSLDYDEQPAHTVTISKSFYVLETKVSDAHYQQSGLPGSAGDVSWDDANAFAEWLGQQDGRTYRLPTESEWEYVYENPGDVENMSGREWVRDWHGTYPHNEVTDPVGPAKGVLKVIRDGGRNRWALPTNARYDPWYLWEAQACSFRLVMEQEPYESPQVSPGPFCKAAVKQSTAPALQGPRPDIPYFTVRFSMPIPPDNMDNEGEASLLGCCPSTMHHNHSPGFEIMPNGDALAVWFSAGPGGEYGDDTRFVQARLRYGSDQWDMPELFWDMKGMNDESGLLWTEAGGTVHFFGGGRIDDKDRRPFVMAVSSDNGATWELKRPSFPVPAVNFEAQPCQNAWRQDGDTIYTVTDGDNPGDSSIVWRSSDNGVTWYDMGGRTNGRHSTIVPIGNSGTLLSLGGKNSSIGGWMPWCKSLDWGASWPDEGSTPFAFLDGNQRPCVTRLVNGKLVFVEDCQERNGNDQPPGWTHGYGCLVAISDNNGVSWHIKKFPVTLPHETDREYGTLGYSTVRQAPSGVIHVLTTMTHPCLHYELNEAWIYSGEGDITPETTGGTVNQYSEYYPGGALKATWGARTCPNGRYLLHGTERSYYEDGTKEHEVTYVNGRKSGTETFWTPDGAKLWNWDHDDVNNVSFWSHRWSTGFKRIESRWNSYPTPRDLPGRNFSGFVAHGDTYHWDQSGTPVAAWNFVDGKFIGAAPLPDPQTKCASNPRPADNSKEVRPDAVLAWEPGVTAVSHDVYFGTDFDHVNNATDPNTPPGRGRQGDNSYVPLDPLGLGTVYYWRIDEVDDANVCKGDVWSFMVTPAMYFVVDDMESYNTTDNKIYDTWMDGMYNGTGSWTDLVIDPNEPVRGGEQSMEYLYDNKDYKGWGLDYYSEISVDVLNSNLKIGTRDWTVHDVKTLTMFFYGQADNDASDTEQMYAGLEDTTGAGSYVQIDYGFYGEDMNDIKEEEWQQWDIALADFTDVILTAVGKLYIGFGIRGNPNPGGTPGGNGTVYFDDIRLYLPKCVPAFASAADFTDDCLVNLRDFAILARQWLQAPGSPSTDIAPEPPDGIVDYLDLATLVDDWLEYKPWPPE